MRKRSCACLWTERYTRAPNCDKHTEWDGFLWWTVPPLVSTYINWSSLSLSTPRMRKANESCILSAAHPLVKRDSNILFRFSSCPYVTTGEIFIGRPPLCKNTPPSPWSYPKGGVHPQSLFVCANHFTSDCFSNKGQCKAGFASTLTPIRDPATAPEPQVKCRHISSMVKSAWNWLTS